MITHATIDGHKKKKRKKDALRKRKAYWLKHGMATFDKKIEKAKERISVELEKIKTLQYYKQMYGG